MSENQEEIRSGALENTEAAANTEEPVTNEAPITIKAPESTESSANTESQETTEPPAGEEPGSTEPPRGSKGGRLAIELILSVVTIAAICLLPTLYLYWHNLESLEFSELMNSVYLFLGIGLGLYAVLRLILRKRPYFAGLLTALIMFLVVNFNLISALPKQILSDYTIANVISIGIVILLIVVGVFLFRALCKQESTGRSVMLVLCIVFIGLIAFNGVQTLFTKEAEDPEPTPAAVTQATATVKPTPKPTPVETEAPEETEVPEGTPDTTDAPTAEPTEAPTPTPVPKTKTPNIYLLVFDEYASMGAMEKYYQYDCSAMRDFMRSAGINWSEYSYSSSRETKVCMTELNMMDYVAYRNPDKNSSQRSKLKSMRKNSELKKVFEKKLGYKLYQHSTQADYFGYVKNLRTRTNLKEYQKTTIDGVESNQIVTEQSILGAFQDIISALTPQEQIKTDSKSLKKYGYYSMDEIMNSKAYKSNSAKNAISNALYFMDFFENPKNFTGKEKRMILGYLKCPHTPFVFDEYGQILTSGKRMKWDKPEIYRGQYVFVSKHIANIFKTIISADPESIIIVMGDHGVRSHTQPFKITAKDDCWIFLACYYQGEQIDMEGMSPVNLMRLVSTNLGVKKAPVKDLVTKNSKSDLSDVKYPKK